MTTHADIARVVLIAALGLALGAGLMTLALLAHG
jgi:hypothetical protein